MTGVSATSLLTAIAVVTGVATWMWRARRPRDAGFAFVYVNQDGTVRELSPGERRYLSTIFDGADGARPYIKSAYKSRDGWGSISGYIERRRVPRRIAIAPVHPEYDARVERHPFDPMGAFRAAGDIVETRDDGSVSFTPNPAIPPRESLERARAHHLAEQRRREALAKGEAE